MNRHDHYTAAVGDALTAAIVTPELLAVAEDWHGGQWSACYRLASTGRVWGWDHLVQLNREIDGDLSGLADDDPESDRLGPIVARLESILDSNPYAAGGILADLVPDCGGYQTIAVTDDGDTLCERCVIDPSNPVHPTGGPGTADGWGIAGWTHGGEVDGADWCAHCGREL